MGFLKRLFGGGEEKPYVDKQGIYFYVQCDNCDSLVKVRADKQYDLQRTDGGFVWHKTIVDNRCFRRMQTVVHLDGNYQVTHQELQGGRFLTEEEYHVLKTEAEADAKAANVKESTDETTVDA